MFQYLPIENEMMPPYLGSYQTFGLRVCRIDTCTDEEIMCLPDISTNYFFVLRLAELFTRKQLDPLHLLEVLEDLL